MTDGHQHRIVHLPRWSLRLHLLQTPITRSHDTERVERSRWTWGHETENPEDGYVLTFLGVLHTLTGLTVDTSPKEKRERP